jgi:hypothetical protein
VLGSVVYSIVLYAADVCRRDHPLQHPSIMLGSVFLLGSLDTKHYWGRDVTESRSTTMKPNPVVLFGSLWKQFSLSS